ncbi:MAG: hypothetical protein Q9217_006297, partial [Psora testacea]
MPPSCPITLGESDVFALGYIVPQRIRDFSTLPSTRFRDAGEELAASKVHVKDDK